VVIHGHTQAKQRVNLRAELAGRVVAIHQPEGAYVKAGDPVVTLASEDLPARLTEAQALVKQRRLAYEANKQLRRNDHIGQLSLAESAALLASAQAEVKAIQVALAKTRIKSPVAGVLDEQPVDLGDYVKEGDQVGLVLNYQPLVVSGVVAQHQIAKLEPGMKGKARLMTGEQLPGQLSFIASEADPATRTFRLEMEIPNPEQRFKRAGLITKLIIPLPVVEAHRVSPALLTLSDQGVLGIKALAADNRVKFHPAEIVKVSDQGVWLAGLPAQLKLISVGQGFTQAGEQVEPVYAENDSL
jgi:multidrug efflux system membrane fusion protein